MKALVVVDYQVDFVDGALGFPGAEKLEQIILDKIANCRSTEGQVIFTLDTHGEEYLSTAEGRKLPRAALHQGNTRTRAVWQSSRGGQA